MFIITKLGQCKNKNKYEIWKGRKIHMKLFAWPQEQTALGRPQCREDHFKVDLKAVEWEGITGYIWPNNKVVEDF
jgi:hypothetical protein